MISSVLPEWTNTLPWNDVSMLPVAPQVIVCVVLDAAGKPGSTGRAQGGVAEVRRTVPVHVTLSDTERESDKPRRVSEQAVDAWAAMAEPTRNRLDRIRRGTGTSRITKRRELLDGS